MNMKVTKKDIADYLGISRTAVSLTLNRSPSCSLSQQTQERILKAARELGYMENGSSVESNKICLALFNIDDNCARLTNSDAVNVIDEYLSGRGYNIIYMNIPQKKSALSRLYDYLETGEPCGVILYNLLDVHVLEHIRQYQIPYMVCSDIGFEGDNIVFPASNDCAEYMVKILAQRGHRRIALFLSALDTPQQMKLLKGYQDGLAELGLPFEPSLVQISDTVSGRDLVQRMRILGITYTAAICSNSWIQMGALNYMREIGIQVPKDISLISYGMNDLVLASSPNLSAVYYSAHDFLDGALAELAECIKKRRTGFPCQEIRKLHYFEGGTVSDAPAESSSQE